MRYDGVIRVLQPKSERSRTPPPVDIFRHARPEGADAIEDIPAGEHVRSYAEALVLDIALRLESKNHFKGFGGGRMNWILYGEVTTLPPATSAFSIARNPRSSQSWRALVPELTNARALPRAAETPALRASPAP